MAALRNSRWLLAAMLGLALLAAGFGLWLTQASDRSVGYDASRNNHDLGLIADSIERWPGTAATMARANLIPSRLEPADYGDSAAGWQARARFWHPVIGRFAIRYALVAPAADCPDADPKKRSGWIARDRLRMAGALSIVELDAADRRIASDLASVAAATADGKPLFPGGGKVACYATELPLDDIVNLRDAAPNASHLLIADADGHVTAQIAAEPLPLSDLSQLPRVTAASESILAKLGKTAVAAPDPKAALEPFRTHFGGRDYTAYTRRIVLPEAGGVLQYASAIMLVPAASSATPLDQPPPIILAGFGLGLLVLLALVPVLKLRLIGPGEALTGIEVAAVGAGVVAVTALATAAVLFAIDVEWSRAEAGVRTADTAKAIRTDFVAETAALISGPPKFGPFDADPGGNCLTAPLSLWSPLEPGMASYPLSEPDAAWVLAQQDSGTRRIKLPPRESVFLTGGDGSLWPGTVIATCRRNNGGRIDVTSRQYWQDALSRATIPVPGMWRVAHKTPAGLNVSVEPGYAVEQIRSQSDGIDKTVFAFPARVWNSATEPLAPNAVLGAASVLRSLTSPVLPPDERFMVIDLDSPGLKVLFHSSRARAGVESVKGDLEKAKLPRVLEQLRHSKPGDEPGSFTSLYDGQRQHFATLQLPGTHWGLLVWHSHDSADAGPARTLQSTLVDWFSVAALLAGLSALAINMSFTARWRWLWPDETRCAQYPRAIRANGVAAAAGLLVWLALPSIPVLAALVWSAGAIVATVRIMRRPEPPAAPLTPGTQRLYRWWLVSLLLLAVALPVAAFHADALRYSDRSAEAAAAASETKGMLDRLAARAAVARAYFSDLRIDTIGDDQQAEDPLGIATACWQPLPGWRTKGSFAQSLGEALRAGSPPGLVTLDTLPPGALLCKEHRGKLKGDTVLERRPPKTEFENGSWMRILWVVIVLAAGLTATGFALGVVWRRLFGLGTPLEAVTYPALPLPATVFDTELEARTLMVKPPLWLEQRLLETGWRIDLAGDAPVPVAGSGVSQPPWSQPKLYIVTGLELIQRDPVRRRAALTLLEALLASPPLRNGGAKLVMLAELMPLEPLMQAYEREKETLAQGEDAAAYEAVRRHLEDTRWSRLFEGFRTYIFATVPKLIVHGGDATAAVLRELAPLPERILAGILPPPVPAPLDPDTRRNATDLTMAFDSHYHTAAETFATSLRAPSAAAAIDFTGLLLIEHYQQLWASSSRPEQLVLHALALGRLPTVAAAGPLKSLIRRGLIVYDPSPRLMNHSFAAFVQRAERPATVARWRKDAPSGGWGLAVWPLLILLPIGLIGIGWSIVDSGQQLDTLLPLLIAGVPVLMQAAGALRKAAAG